ncbi:hypothetical protein [Oceanobacillus halophilus]|uniref:Uncharacterized protein n=1 Tax=Oceanobacillus halophilus TaxID=930130 RepID=A0A494ZT68_9BACI|nr:hypothetical protein [Oceanobacillus halophilus]RKQ29343.1 hypothetical protein D8M06_17770 [Oceanobacillus halophilus]
MGKFKYSEPEKEINKVLKHHDDLLKSIPSLDADHTTMNESIASSEALLKGLGLGHKIGHDKSIQKQKKTIQIPSWEDVRKDASISQEDVDLRSLFTEEELVSNERYLKHLRDDFNHIHRLDAVDYSICVAAGILAAAVDIFLVGFPEKTKNGISAGPLSNYMREKFDEAIPADKIKQLERQFKVPYDASTNYHLNEYVDGLSSWFHRYHSLGHDPILGFIFGVFDILNGRFTAIDKNGKIISQLVGDAPEGMTIFQAIGQVFGHMKSDVNTSMGLPAPMMTLFNMLQFGSIGEEKLSIAEVARGMYAEGYDFKHFCSMSIPTMLIEVIVRVSYCIKRLKEGHRLKESIPINGIRRKKPKLQTMLFISHTISSAVNGGKVYFTQNPLAINYKEWLAFAKYSISQMKWSLYEKPNLRNAYVDGKLKEEWESLHLMINDTWASMERDYIVIK